ncbi:glutamate synthase subunit beta [Halorhodospira halophila]|uniref:Glutamate synthase (NADH) small subunit n=1 Tax=Halorhodospira halophila (strain DSM 244 / SL1) TaxID=349124 RepID=A1WXG8_HALHL|nr:glutamate synthase subunit beta [Halorhodospira halophila]ABM62380.1 glutamate synthase (NADH) small subunit [Halorhodospira halophila SL1]MBK1730125.1 glutamate synthase subunit beta [Halorhodospira halophila]
MGKQTGFLEHERQEYGYQPACKRVFHYGEFLIPLSREQVGQQGARCMDCGIPFCHSGCPVDNLIPNWNDMVYRGEWERAVEELHATNNFPEFTGRVCPAPCEASCTLNLDDSPVSIKTIECSIVDRAWEAGLIRPRVARRRTGKRIAVVGSGPAGLACAQQLARVGHNVDVYEKADAIGGLLRYGIPDFKLEKRHIDRRIAQMRTEGVQFHTLTHVGVDIPIAQLRDEFDSVVLAGGSEQPRDLPVPGRELNGVHFAMEFLTANSKRVQGVYVPDDAFIDAQGKHVVVIGGGDTGSDCVGTSCRHGARSVTQVEILNKPPEKEDKELTWPYWPEKLNTSTSHQEGCERMWNFLTKEFVGDGSGHVRAIRYAKVEWHKDQQGRWQMSEIPGSEAEMPADRVFLAMGFLHPVRAGMIAELEEKGGLELDDRGNVRGDTEGADAYKTSTDGVFVAGDMRRGQSLVVWAIREGRQCAHAVDKWLQGTSDLPR